MIKVLFICSANTCRSPVAEHLLKKIVNENNLSEHITCESRGIISGCGGKNINYEMQKICLENGLNIENHISIELFEKDFGKYNYLIPMDEKVLNHVERMAKFYSSEENILLLREFGENAFSKNIPDPFLSDGKFDYLKARKVFDIINDSVKELFQNIIEEYDI